MLLKCSLINEAVIELIYRYAVQSIIISGNIRSKLKPSEFRNRKTDLTPKAIPYRPIRIIAEAQKL